MISISRKSLPPPGARVRLRGAAWSVVQHTAYDDCIALRLAAPPDAVSCTFLLPFDRLGPAKNRELQWVSSRTWLRRLGAAVAAAYPFGGLRHAAPGVDLLPFQLEPALATLRHGHPRLLIADDVGMGKTIEAGVVLRELMRRADGFRALVLVPAGLRQQWRAELRGKFAVDPILADAAWLRDIARVLPPDVNPWSPPGTYIASFDFVKRPEALRGLELERWDLVVVDEAHACGTTTDRRAAVDAVARRAHRVLLLTATPPPADADLEALAAVGASGGARAPMLRRCRDAGGSPQRRSVLLAVRPTAAEGTMHRLLERYTRVLWRRAGVRALQRLLGTVLRKRALSSAASLGRSLRRRLELLDGQPVPASRQLLLPLGGLEEDPQDDCVGDGLLAAGGIGDPNIEKRWLARLIAAADAAAHAESKARSLLKLLGRAAEPAIVFTEYRDTLEHLHTTLRDLGVAACALHGGLSHDERRAALSTFGQGRHVLLATDTAAEGLNLQHRCRLVIHYELPWNPARMLQRAGRVDRLGQRRRVHETVLVARDTAEAMVLAPLVRRALRSSGSGAGQRMIELLSESRVAAMVFEGGAPEDPPAASAPCPVVRVDYSGEAHDEAKRLLEQRRLAASLPSTVHGAAGLPVAMVRLRGLEPGVVLVFELRFTAANGDVEERDVIAIHLKTGPLRWRASRCDFSHRLMRVLPTFAAAAGPTLRRLLRQRLQLLQPVLLAARRRAQQRDEELRNFDGSAARRLVQRGLFERRAPAVMPAPADGGPDPADDGRLADATALSASSELMSVLIAVRR